MCRCSSSAIRSVGALCYRVVIWFIGQSLLKKSIGRTLTVCEEELGIFNKGKEVSITAEQFNEDFMAYNAETKGGSSGSGIISQNGREVCMTIPRWCIIVLLFGCRCSVCTIHKFLRNALVPAAAQFCASSSSWLLQLLCLMATTPTPTHGYCIVVLKRVCVSACLCNEKLSKRDKTGKT